MKVEEKKLFWAEQTAILSWDEGDISDLRIAPVLFHVLYLGIFASQLE